MVLFFRKTYIYGSYECLSYLNNNDKCNGKMMKKYIYLGVCAAFLSGCGGGGDGDDKKPQPDNNGQTPTIEQPVMNLAPVAKINGLTSVLVNQSLELDGSESHDPNSDVISYTWSIVEQPSTAKVSLSQDNVIQPVFSTDTAGRYRIKLVVNDGKRDSDPSYLTVLVKKSDTTPQARLNDWYKAEVKVGEAMSLQSLSKDADEDSLTTVWTLKSKPTQSSATVIRELEYGDTLVEFKADVVGQYVIELKVTDPQGNSDQLEFSIDAVIGNSAPVAKITSEKNTTTVYERLYFSGYESFDYDKDKLQGKWSLVSKPEGSYPKLDGVNYYSESLFTTFIPDKAGEYVIEFVVNDGKAVSKPARQVIHVTNLGLLLKNLDDETTALQWPYKSESNQYAVQYNCAYERCDQWAADFARFSLKPTDRDYHIVDYRCKSNVKVESIYGSQVAPCSFDFGLARSTSEGYAIYRLNGTYQIKLSALASKEQPVEYEFSFKILETGETFNYKVNLSVL